MLAPRAKCIYKVQREAIATVRHALKLLANRCFGERRDNPLRRLYAHRAGASSAAWLVTLFPSFTLSFFASTLQRVLSLSPAIPTAVRALTCHWPCPLASAARSLVCLLGHLSVALSLSAHRFPLFSFASSSSSPSDSRVYSRALTVVSSPCTDTCLSFFSRRFSYSSERGKLKKRQSNLS